jgi:hypothetical protein
MIVFEGRWLALASQRLEQEAYSAETRCTVRERTDDDELMSSLKDLEIRHHGFTLERSNIKMPHHQGSPRQRQARTRESRAALFSEHENEMRSDLTSESLHAAYATEQISTR